ncbi:MAG: hypothetical protein EBY29_09850 [Planctomycetes bacterium]|nr:hypothetical protein [Planctomycetota bacterium]
MYWVNSASLDDAVAAAATAGSASFVAVRIIALRWLAQHLHAAFKNSIPDPVIAGPRSKLISPAITGAIGVGCRVGLCTGLNIGLDSGLTIFLYTENIIIILLKFG